MNVSRGYVTPLAVKRWWLLPFQYPDPGNSHRIYRFLQNRDAVCRPFDTAFHWQIVNRWQGRITLALYFSLRISVGVWGNASFVLGLLVVCCGEPPQTVSSLSWNRSCMGRRRPLFPSFRCLMAELLPIVWQGCRTIVSDGIILCRDLTADTAKVRLA